VPLLFGHRVKQLYLKEFSRVWLLWEEARSVDSADLDLRVARVRMIHRGAFATALRRSRASDVYGSDGDPVARAALERSLLEPVAQRFLQMTADDVLAYETRHDDAPEPG
jgi:hypothetical protein